MLPPDLQARAALFRPAEVRRRVFNPMVRPHWIGGEDRFWYAHEGPDGITHVAVDAATGERRPIVPPAASPEVAQAGEVLSPDGRWAAYCRDHNLWLRDVASGARRALTTDGAAHHAYGKSPDANLTTITLRRRGIVLPAAVLWSPDSRRIFTCRLDERAVAVLPIVQHVPDDGSVRPVLHALRVAFSGEAAIPFAEPVVIDVAEGIVRFAALPPEPVFTMTTVEREEAWWSGDGTRVFHLARDRAQRRLTLWETEAVTGVARAVLSEESETFSDVNLSVTGLPNIRVLDATGEVVWFSQSDGRAHLYLHDLATGALKNRITSGDLIVRDLAHVDEATRTVLFLAGNLEPGADPARRKLCRVGLDGSRFAVLTPEPGDHTIAMPVPRPPRDFIRPPLDTGWFLSPSGRYFVHTVSTLDSAPVSVLRRIDGTPVATLATAEMAPDLAAAWCWPVPFTARAADGATVLHGAIWRPADFDAGRSYPVIDYIYPGPQRGNLPTAALADTLAELGVPCLAQAFAELGFVVVVVDGRGAPLREKPFHDLSYGHLQNPGRLEDHVAVLGQLGARHAWIDMARIGIMGHSGGGYASVRALLDHPEVFRAAVATSGNHDQRGYSFAWCEKYQGELEPDGAGGSNYDACTNIPFADRLQGRLMIGTGDMDDNVHPALTIQLAHALIRADKDFDFVVVPNADHTNVWSSSWFLRRAMAFMRDALAA